ncbi:MAG: HRDC domain-containing protein [Planctomycetota bacterium]|nr:HRDC domain-containing protein [Planctomycetota bacterium]
MTHGSNDRPRDPADLPPPTLVQDAAGLRALLHDLDRARDVAVDTEGDSLYSYRERVCLIQVTANERDWLVDPLSGLDLSGLGAVMADPAKRKVFHDGEYDVLTLKRDHGFLFQNLFDTRVAAATLGSKTPGLATVLQERFGIALDKSMQRSNWGQRPLSDKQIRYARLDTHFLIPLMGEQIPELERTDRHVIVASECRRLEMLMAPDHGFDPDDWVRLKGARALPPIDRQVLRELFSLRDEIARAENEPPFRVLNNETLLALVFTKPRTRPGLQAVPGFSPRQARKFGDDVLAAIARALELGPLTRFPRQESREGTDDFDEEQIELHERLKQLRKVVAEAAGIDSAYVLNRHVLLRIALERPTNLAALAQVEGVHAWQIERFGARLVDVVARFEDERRRGVLPIPARRRRP